VPVLIAVASHEQKARLVIGDRLLRKAVPTKSTMINRDLIAIAT
jgi:hypothetical protein